jgi:hypothetical protein
VCLGLSSPEFANQLEASVRQALEPYGSPCENRFSQETDQPTLILPGDLLYRYGALQRWWNPVLSGNNNNNDSILALGQTFKTQARALVSNCVQGLVQSNSTSGSHYPQYVQDEEQGYLSVYVIAVPHSTLHRPTHLFSGGGTSKRRRHHRHLDHSETQQGGDPRKSLEERMKKQGITVWSLNQALNSNLDLISEEADRSILEQTKAMSEHASGFDFHVAVWRRPFYLRGLYTKLRRDVSQTPFFVVDEGKRRKLGVTSVEEQIVPVVSRYSGGISCHNKDPSLPENVVFGMCKFHASGREDMDVRMLLPEASASDTSNRLASGRPFVCEVIDALRLPSVTDLLRIVDNVNKTTSVNENMTLPRCYGRNDMTSISRDFSFAPASSFKNLQAETEDKVKFYGCLCWSATPLPKEDEDLTKLLGTFPLQLKQRTPIRVLHRRSNMIRVRHVLSAQAHRIDDHYFRLHISTDAGTCESFEKARSLVFWNLLTNRTFSVLQT